MSEGTELPVDFSNWLDQTEASLTGILATRSSEFSDTGGGSDRLFDAMRYAVLDGGKRTRALLVFAAANSIDAGTNPTLLANTAACVELIHAYSLVHDDLPAMDDDELRRGKPSCHMAFDEATAILAGDALQALAFETLAGLDCHALIRLELVRCLAAAGGPRGMVGGQQLDMCAEGQQQSLEQLQQMHQCKTGALIRAATLMGGIVAGAGHDALQALDQYANRLGLAFQIQDDILDIEASTEALGKPAGADRKLAKSTYPELLGLDGSKQRAAELVEEALGVLTLLPGDTGALDSLAQFVIKRSH